MGTAGGWRQRVNLESQHCSITKQPLPPPTHTCFFSFCKIHRLTEPLFVILSASETQSLPSARASQAPGNSGHWLITTLILPFMEGGSAQDERLKWREDRTGRIMWFCPLKSPTINILQVWGAVHGLRIHPLFSLCLGGSKLAQLHW